MSRKYIIYIFFFPWYLAVKCECGRFVFRVLDAKWSDVAFGLSNLNWRNDRWKMCRLFNQRIRLYLFILFYFIILYFIYYWFLGKSALQILTIVTATSLAVCMRVCVYPISQVPFFYSFFLTFVFECKTLAFYFNKYLANGERQNRHYHRHRIGSRAFAIEWRHCDCGTLWSLRIFSRSPNFWKSYI